jgi:hypothetical protein
MGELTYEIDVWFQEKNLTNDARLDWETPPSRTYSYMFGWVIVSRQLHFDIYYLFLGK